MQIKILYKYKIIYDKNSNICYIPTHHGPMYGSLEYRMCCQACPTGNLDSQ